MRVVIADGLGQDGMRAHKQVEAEIWQRKGSAGKRPSLEAM